MWLALDIFAEDIDLDGERLTAMRMRRLVAA
jgi:hypothetical protein